MDNPKGLGSGEWIKTTKAQKSLSAIDRLADPKIHANTLEYLNKRLKLSEEAMSAFYSRWRVNELKYQGFINLSDWEQELKRLNNKGDPAKLVSVTVPYSFSVLSTIVTYLIHTFAGHSPMFSVTSNKSEYQQAAQMMEQTLQYNAMHIKLIKHLYQFLNDACMYGVGIMRVQFKTEKKLRTRWIETAGIAFGGISLTGKKWTKERKEVVTFEGNDVNSIDPFMFFPDPRVPMSEVNTRGEFAFWKEFIGRHELLAAEKAGDVKYVNKAPTIGADSIYNNFMSARGAISNGDAAFGYSAQSAIKSDVYEATQGTCVIIPSELGLGEETYPVKYLFTWLNKKQIIQAEPLNYDHDKHPVVVTEPYSMGYGFGQPGIIDYMAPLQDVMSWLINSHMDNVKTMLNNMWLVDPSRVEMQDLKQPGAGKLIRLKRAAYGTDVNAAVRQLQVGDVTSGHLRDFELIMRMADTLASVNDNLKGIQDSGGRKTATEVRVSNDAGASRLAALAKKISAQGITDLTEQMSLNLQQFLSDDFYLDINGIDGQNTPMKVSPQMLVGDFNFPVSDGTLPVDRVAMVDVWKQIFQVVAADQGLRQQIDVMGVFKYVAQLGGAKNINQFVLKQAPDEQLMQDVQAGNTVPAGEVLGSPTPGIVPNPADRLAGGL